MCSLLALFLHLACGTVASAQTKDPVNSPPSAAIKIDDKPRAIDPATLLPPALSAPVTVDFAEASLGDIVRWLQTERKLGVVVEQGVLVSEAVSEKLADTPLYILLNRLSVIGVNWHVEGGVIHLTLMGDDAKKLTNVSYNVSDLLDAGYKSDPLIDAIGETISTDSWLDNGGPGSVQILGDVLFVNQTRDLQLQVAGLLAALRKHGRRTYVADPASHEPLRAALASVVNAEFQETPWKSALERLAKQAKVEIRFDQRSIRGLSVRERQPITLSMNDQKLSVVLQAILHRFGMTWTIRDGAIWIESRESAGGYRKTAVYDVRDLCRDGDESEALSITIMSQLAADEWLDNGGKGVINFPRPGVMVVSQTEMIHDSLLELLENYRAALRVSKPRPRAVDDPQEVVTRYYRLPKVVADDLATALPQLIEPDSWRSEMKPNAAGTIVKLASKAEVVKSSSSGSDNEPGVSTPYTVLVIKQTRAIHDKLPDLLGKILEGDAPTTTTIIGHGGGGMGGGGFGGGFF